MKHRIFEAEGRIRIEEMRYGDARKHLSCWQPGRSMLFYAEQTEEIMRFYGLTGAEHLSYRLKKWLNEEPETSWN